jgi:hypothetical protein
VAPSHGMAQTRVCGAGSVANTGGVAVSLPCRGVRIGEARVWGDIGGGAVVTQAKGAAVSLPCHGAEAKASRGRSWRWKGMLTSGPRLSAARVGGIGERWYGWRAGLEVGCVCVGHARGGRGKGAGPGCPCWARFGLEDQVGLG